MTPEDRTKPTGEQDSEPTAAPERTSDAVSKKASGPATEPNTDAITQVTGATGAAAKPAKPAKAAKPTKAAKDTTEADSETTTKATKATKATKPKTKKAAAAADDPEASDSDSADAKPAKAKTRRRGDRPQALPGMNPTWWVPVMLGLMVVGLIWTVSFYLGSNGTDDTFPIPGIGYGNLAIGFGMIMAGFIMTTRWK